MTFKGRKVNMSAKTMPSLADENRDLRKQIGCMNGLFQIFDRHHFLTGRRISSHSNKKLLQGAEHQLDQQYATKGVREKGVETPKEKPRISTESSRASFSSASCSSTFSSLDYNRTAQPETPALRRSNMPERQFQTTSAKEQQPSSTKGMRSPDLRDIVKESMYREVRSLSIKSLSNDERRGTVMKHIDSPRPSQQPKPAKPKSIGSTRVTAKVQEVTKHSKDERLALARYSYDGRESRETYRLGMKHKELPRLSLDSKTGSTKAFESTLSFLRREPHVENNTSSPVVPLNQEPESHNKTSNVIAKLMGLNAISHPVSTDRSVTPTIKSFPKEAFLSQSTSTPEDSKRNPVNYSPRVKQNNNPASPSPKMQSANFFRKPTTSSRFPVESAPWRQQGSSQGSPKMASKNRKTLTSTLQQTSSVYGEIEKRVTELEFKKSGKDLRALKQILEAMQKTRERLEDQGGEPAELALQMRCSLEEENRKTYHQVPTINRPRSPKQSGPVVIMKPDKAMDKVKLSVSTRVPTAETSHLQRIQTWSPKYKQGSPVHCHKASNLTPENDNVRYPSRRLPSTDKKTSWSPSEQPSPRFRHDLLRIEGQSRPTTPSSDLRRVKTQSSKKVIEKGSQNRKSKVKAKDQPLSDDQLSEISCETRYSSYQGDTASVKSESNNSFVSQTETEIISMARSININTRPKEDSVSTTGEHVPAVESAVTMLEQPSPISVLDSSFYGEDTPSPVKKISTVFQDERPSPDEAEWHLETLNHLTDCTRYNDSCKYNQKLEDMRNSVHSLTLSENEPDRTTADNNGSLSPDYRYINKILLTSGLLKDSSFISTTDQLLSSNHLINPEMFHVLEQTEEIREAMNGGAMVKNDRMHMKNRTQRKIIFDMVDEILVHKITSGRLFTVGNGQTNPQGLMEEVHSEMDRVCRIQHCNLSEVDETRGLISADMTHQSKDWTSYSAEVPALVLDIERLIFKDLISEVVTGEVWGRQDWPKSHCRKLLLN